jgi:ribosomal protein S18 acetylase RimI-like enzyme
VVDLTPPLRRATSADAAALADLINMAGEGLPSLIWQEMAADGEDPWELGRRRQARKADEGQVFVVDDGAGAVAALTGYQTPAVPVVIADDDPPLFRPLQELENLALSTWYVNVLAAYPEQRGRGHGTRLLALAEDITHELGLSAMSIIVASGNAGARRLYERIGYVETARRPIVKGGWDIESSEWVLLIKQI